jgi:hypothetical protein
MFLISPGGIRKLRKPSINTADLPAYIRTRYLHIQVCVNYFLCLAYQYLGHVSLRKFVRFTVPEISVKEAKPFKYWLQQYA